MRLNLKFICLGLMLFAAIQLNAQISQYALPTPHKVCNPLIQRVSIPPMGYEKVGTTTLRSLNEQHCLPDLDVISICTDKRGVVWFGFRSGEIACYDGNDIVTFDQVNFFKAHPILNIICDSQGNLWFGTWGNGLIKYDGYCFYQYSTNNGWISDNISCIFEDSANRIWVGTSDNGIVCIEKDTYSRITKNDGINGNSVWTISEDYESIIWLGDENGLCRLKFFEKNLTILENYPISIPVRSIIHNNQVTLLGTEKGLLIVENNAIVQQDFAIQGPVYSMIKSFYDERNILIASRDNGLFIYSNDSLHSVGRKLEFNSTDLICIEEGHDHSLWIGTLNNGVLKYSTQQFQNYDS
ncbi:MAG: hypothetical protein KDC80_16025, partial [Saprospiraceae bacterium]|nr:hypothetical protein [Saprospiraceae bacterium]